MAHNGGKPFYPQRSFAQSQPSTLSAAVNEEMAATAQDARAILKHLLADLQTDQNTLSKRYKEWIEKSEGLERFLFGCLRPEVLMFLKAGSWTTDAIRNISGDLKFDGRAIYVHSIYGLDKRIFLINEDGFVSFFKTLTVLLTLIQYSLRVYVGQSQCLVRRLKDHWNFRFRRDNPSLHYHAMQYSSFDTFSVLAVLPQPTNPSYHTAPGIDQPQLILNILEMWCSLLFRSLPEETLQKYLPPSSTINHSRGAGGLNIANPLDHGGKGRRDWVDLSNSKDPLVREYLEVSERKRSTAEATLDQTQEKKTTEVAKPDTEKQEIRQGRHGAKDQDVSVNVPVTPGAALVIVAAVGLCVYLVKKKTP